MPKKSNYRTGYVSDKDFNEAMMKLKPPSIILPVKCDVENPQSINDYYVEIPQTYKGKLTHKDGRTEEIELPSNKLFKGFRISVSNFID